MSPAKGITSTLFNFIIRFKKDELLAESASVVFDKRGTIYTLTIDDATLNDDGPFSVKASNLVGEVTATARLQVKGVYVVMCIDPAAG